MIQTGDITRADGLLIQCLSLRGAQNGIPKGKRMLYKRLAQRCVYKFQTASQMQPGNPEYQAAVNQMNQQRGGFMRGNPNVGYQNQPAGSMDCCTSLCCADCCCEMMGGDLIPCC